MTPEMTPENALIRHAVLNSAKQHAIAMDLMNSDQRAALVRDLIEHFDLVVGVIEFAPGVHRFHTIKQGHGSVTGIPFISADVAEAIAEMYASEVKQPSRRFPATSEQES